MPSWPPYPLVRFHLLFWVPPSPLPVRTSYVHGPLPFARTLISNAACGSESVLGIWPFPFISLKRTVVHVVFHYHNPYQCAPDTRHFRRHPRLTGLPPLPLRQPPSISQRRAPSSANRLLSYANCCFVPQQAKYGHFPFSPTVEFQYFKN